MAAREMITFDLATVRFTYRVAGVALRDGHVLLHRAGDEDLWALPGGRCEAMESSVAALARELREETGETVRVVRLLWIAATFFTHAGITQHELGLYHLLALPEGSPLLDVRAAFRGCV